MCCRSWRAVSRGRRTTRCSGVQVSTASCSIMVGNYRIAAPAIASGSSTWPTIRRSAMTAAKAEDLVTRAESAERAGRREEAFAAWSELVGAFPDHPRALFLRGRRRMEEGDAAGALALFTQSEARDASLPEAPFFVA